MEKNCNVTCPVCNEEWLVLTLLPTDCDEYAFFQANGYLLIVCEGCDSNVDWNAVPAEWFSAY